MPDVRIETYGEDSRLIDELSEEDIGWCVV
jgi:hypothetical protein